MFSVVIPLYNKEKTIERAIRSVLRQTFPHFEVVIVNDGSVDRSAEIANNICDPRLNVYSQNNGGVSFARNTGINLSRNEYIVFLDADDEWEPDFLESIKYLIEKYPDSVMFATSRVEKSALSGRSNIILSKYNTAQDFVVREYLNEPHIIQMSSMCVRKSLITKVGGFPLKIKIGEDVDFKLRIACAGTIAYLNIPKTIYYLASDNNSFSYRCKLQDIFPYWKWYFYPYPNKLLLFKHTTAKLVDAIKRVYFPNTFKNRIPGKL